MNDAFDLEMRYSRALELDWKAVRRKIQKKFVEFVKFVASFADVKSFPESCRRLTSYEEITFVVERGHGFNYSHDSSSLADLQQAATDKPVTRANLWHPRWRASYLESHWSLWRMPAGLPARSCKPDRKSTRLNSSHRTISYAVFCL